MIKNISKAEVLVLKDQVAYQEGQVVSKTLAQNDALSVTLFSFDKGEEISTHESGGDAFVTCLDGVGEITINGEKYAFDSDGRMLWGWVNDVSEMCNEGTDWQTAMYYCGAEDDGARKSGWQFIDVEENRENLEKNSVACDLFY